MQMLNIKPKSKLTRTIFMHGIEACLLPKGSMLIEEKTQISYSCFVRKKQPRLSVLLITYYLFYFFLFSQKGVGVVKPAIKMSVTFFFLERGDKLQIGYKSIMRTDE